MDDLAEAEKLFHGALALHQRGDLAQAEAGYERALALAPGRASVMNNLAAVYLERGKLADARRLCESVLQNDPQDEAALLNLGNCLVRQDLAAEALVAYERALRIRPGYPDAMKNRGNALLALQRPGEALVEYDRSIAVSPEDADLHFNRGNALLALKRAEEAVASYERAIAIRRGHAGAHYNRGNALMKLDRLEDALASHDRALALKPDHVGALNNRGIVLQRLGRRKELIENHGRLLAVAPDHPYIPGSYLHAQLDCCVWQEYEACVAQIAEGVRAGRHADSPFHFLAISESAADQLICARTCVAEEYPASAQPVWRGERYDHQRIRVAYVSADLHHHAVPLLIAGLFEMHDRARFEVTAISLGPDRNDEMRSRLKSAVDRFVDVRDRGDPEVSALLRELEIDVAVDLQGFTLNCRPGIFANRAAPVQVNYLGYPGTMGADYMDYIVADRHVIPPEDAAAYSEKIVWLPDSYQVNDRKRRIAGRTPSRAELGLPQDAFVYCCFNNNYKIAPYVFDVWMRILRGTERSVLWLLEDNPVATGNLRREAEARGVAADRLVFAPRMRTEEHLARQRRADLFLDTRPYNAHVTASDALWAGLPVLTCRGSTFAGRVATSLLNAAGVPELVTTSWDEYQRLALRLAADRDLLAAMKERLARNRDTCPLFDTDRFRRHIESAYATMHERARRGEAPASFAVAPVDGAGER